MSVIDAIKSRRSIRKYKSDAIPREIIEQIVEAGEYAASGMNRQQTIVVAITNKEIRDRLSKDNASVMGRDGDPFYGAPAVLVVLAAKDCPTGIYDGSLVMGNLMLAAHHYGIGSCWIQVRLRGSDDVTAEEFVKKEAGLDPSWNVLSIVAFGRRP